MQAALTAAYSNEATCGLNEHGSMSVAHERLQEVVAGMEATLQQEHALFLRVRRPSLD